MIIERLLRVALLGSSWVMYLLLGLSVLSFSAMIERWLYFRKRQDDIDALRRKLAEALFEQDFERADELLSKSPSIEARVVRTAIPWAHGGSEAAADVIDSEVSRTKKDLERGMTLLGTLGNNAPFVGLFGTVLGVIEAFHHLADGQNKAAMGNVMGSIAEALVATGVGLFVALPAVVAYNVAQKRIGEIESGVASLGKLLTASLKLRDHAPRPADDRPSEHEVVEAPRSNGVAAIAAEV